MAKVSIGLRGWRFEESAVFTDEGDLKPVDEMDSDVSRRVARLSALVGTPCNACWLIHGDENLGECNVAAAVYGEPLAEVVLCETHEPDFEFWFREEGGREHRGEESLQDAFFEWFADGGRAPEGYAATEHVETDPEDLPDAPPPHEPHEPSVSGTDDADGAAGADGDEGADGAEAGDTDASEGTVGDLSRGLDDLDFEEE